MTIVVGSVVHALLIDGTMGIMSKAALCALVLVVAAKVAVDLRLLADIRRIVSRDTHRARRTSPMDGSCKSDGL